MYRIYEINYSLVVEDTKYKFVNWTTVFNHILYEILPELIDLIDWHCPYAT